MTKSASTLLYCALFALLAAACGSRLDRETILAQNGVGGRTSRAAAADAATATDTDTSTTLAPGASAASTDSGDGGGADGVDGGDRGVARSGDGGGGGCAGAPLKVGVIGSFSGIAGLVTVAGRTAVQAWAASVNAKPGCINGHPVQVLAADDGGDGATSKAIAQDFVENQHVIAFLEYLSANPAAVADYAKTANVPFIGPVKDPSFVTNNPMYFPTAETLDGQGWSLARTAADRAITKVALVYCTELQVCANAAAPFKAHAAELGITIVDEEAVSLAATDYTINCLNMQNKGAQAAVLVIDTNSAGRYAKSCSRQGLKFQWIVQSPDNAMTAVPELDGALAAIPDFPWFLHSGSPALEEYTQALQRYAPDLAKGGVEQQAAGWAAGKLFELAAQQVSDQPTSADILRGLWAIRDETLGGLLAAPVSYVEGAPAPVIVCGYPIELEGGAWTAPQGMTAVCR